MLNAQHEWVTYYNPRNGQIRIKACAKCGVARGPRLNQKSCREAANSDHKMISAGWQTARTASHTI